ncbi:sensor domain-containing diguanylate cyclase [Eggerthella sinensis]|uniref:sensor domain-containing diguanylate cyclase n=1 Tax=Eggerthella sinensis TaxID=242230 RepID=UPI00266BA546|nr:diguanylate cyclase [Eggerthella sinensis]
MPHDDKAFELLKKLVDQKNHELESVFDAIADGIGKFACNDEFSILYYNDGLARLCGLDRGVVESRGFNSSLYIYDEDQPRLERAVQHAVETGEPFSITYRLVHADGHRIWVKTNGMLTEERYQDAYPVMYLFYTDVTDVVEANERLRIELERQRILMDLTGEMFVEYDYASDELTMLGAYGSYYDGPSTVGRFSRFWIDHPDDRSAATFKGLYDLVERADDATAVECRFARRDGGMAWFSVSGRIIKDQEGNPRKGVYRLADIDEQKRERERLQRQASTDHLTGASNLGAAASLIAARLEHAEAGATGALMIFDLDDFKGVNDTFGHPRGDAVLQGSTQAIRSVVRDRDIVGRIGGDEFCIYLDALSSVEEAKLVAERICAQLPGVGERAIGAPVTCSIGISACVGGAKTYEQLYDEADRALYEAKTAGRNRYKLFGEVQA